MIQNTSLTRPIIRKPLLLPLELTPLSCFQDPPPLKLCGGSGDVDGSFVALLDSGAWPTPLEDVVTPSKPVGMWSVMLEVDGGSGDEASCSLCVRLCNMGRCFTGCFRSTPSDLEV